MGTANSALDNIAFYQKCGFRMSAVKRDFFDYIQPRQREHGIEMRDMIVFSYDANEPSGIRVLLISGSTRVASTNTAALRTVRTVAPGGVTAVLFDGLAELPPFTPDDDTPPMPVERLRRQLAAADVVLFCTPEYAGALPGSFKNLIDWTVGSGELYRKPVAWINVAAGGRGGGASAELRTVLGYVDAAVIEPACVRLPVPGDAIGPDGTVADDDVRAGLIGVLRTITEHCTEARQRGHRFSDVDRRTHRATGAVLARIRWYVGAGAQLSPGWVSTPAAINCPCRVMRSPSTAASPEGRPGRSPGRRRSTVPRRKRLQPD